MGGDRGSARAGHGHSQKPECEQENTLTTHTRTRGCWDCEPGSSHDAAAAEAATMSGGHSWRRAPQSLPRPQVRGSDPARPGREQRPLGRTAGPGSDRQSGARPVPSSRGPLAPHPRPGPLLNPHQAQTGRQHPRPGPARRSRPPVSPPAPRRPPSPHLLTSPPAGPQQLCQAPASHPAPALCGRVGPVHSAAARAPGGRREPGGGSGQGGGRPLAGRGEGGGGLRRRRRVGSARVRAPRRGVRALGGGGAHGPAWPRMGWGRA